jgi:hypothetical protein
VLLSALGICNIPSGIAQVGVCIQSEMLCASCGSQRTHTTMDHSPATAGEDKTGAYWQHMFS